MSTSISAPNHDESPVDVYASEAFEKAAGSDPPPSRDLGGILYIIQLIFTAVRTVFKWWSFAKDVQARISRAIWTVEAYIKFLLGSISDLIRTLLIDPSALVLNPLRTIVSLFVYFAVQVTAFLMVTLIGVARLLGIVALLKSWAKKYGGGNSIWNMGDPTFFTAYDGIVKNAIKVFTSGCGCPNSTVNDDGEEEVGERVRYFNLDVAKTLLLFSAAMYERDENENNKAILLSIQNQPELAQAARTIAEAQIYKIAARWGLKFKGISDLNSYGGSFAGIWWQEGGNWVVVSFKGTTPFDGAEWLKDLTTHKTNGKAYLYGAIHEGWYKSLFANYENNVGYSPYGTIVETITSTAAYLNRPKVHVYVTGHSLGSALAEAFYGRIVKSPKDLGHNIVVRNAYLYGSPRIGDVEWAAGFYSAVNAPFGNLQTLFRVIDRFDMVCHYPSGLGENPRERDFLKPHSLLNYAHVGEAVWLTGSKNAIITGNPLTAGVTIHVVQDTSNSSSSNGVHSDNAPPKATGFNPIPILEALTPWPLRDHLPPKYMKRLNKLVPTYDPTAQPKGFAADVRRKVKKIVDKAKSDVAEFRHVADTIKNDVSEVRTAIGDKVAKNREEVRSVVETIKKDGTEIRGLVGDKVAKDKEEIRNAVDKISKDKEDVRDKVAKDKEDARTALEDAARHAAFNAADRSRNGNDVAATTTTARA